MGIGKANRLARVFRPTDGFSVMLALDHGYALGPIKGLERPAEVIKTLQDHVDALMATRGVFNNCFTPDGRAGIVLRVSGAVTIAGPDLNNESLTATIDDALRLAADAVASSIFVGTDNERESIKNLARLVSACAPYDMPVLAVTAVGKDREKQFDSRYLALACRVAAEHGADMVKTYFSGDSFETVTRSCPVPIIIAGGPKLETEVDVFRMARAAMDQGARGIDMGRNVWQNANPVGMIKALDAIVHDGASVDDAVAIFNEVR